ncbi:sensor histidine kinase [Thermoclostridium stercorarium]|nr:ATP-binding protein [Thermoclostridium stercorarium]
MDIAQNSITAGATLIKVSLICCDGFLVFRLSDNGNGMDEELLKTVTDPFTTTRETRKVGMGIPLLKLSAEMTGGSFKIESRKGEGTSTEARFVIDSIDRIPLGNVDETLKTLIMANPEIDFEIKFQSEKSSFELKTEEIKKYLNGVPIDNFEVIDWIAGKIRDGLKVVFGGVLNEISG